VARQVTVNKRRKTPSKKASSEKILAIVQGFFCIKKLSGKKYRTAKGIYVFDLVLAAVCSEQTPTHLTLFRTYI